MADVSHLWGQDLTAGANGDLATVSGAALGRQRVLRRLLTNPGDYIWHLDYGAGLSAYVGQPEATVVIQAVVVAQLALESAVAQSPPPTVTTNATPDGVVVVSISYVDADTGEPQVIGISVDSLGATEV